jgi:hypothetical protein
VKFHFAPKLVAAFALTAAAAASQAAIVVYNSQAAFTAATTAVGTDTFNNMALVSTPSPLFRAAGTYAYTASSANGFFPAGTLADVWLSNNTATDSIVFSAFGSNPTAIGGFFFGSDINGAFAAGTSIIIDVTDSSGTVSQTIANSTQTSFLGFTTDTSLVSMTVRSVQPAGAFRWGTINDLQLGRASTGVPEPGSFALAGLAMLAAFGARRRA